MTTFQLFSQLPPEIRFRIWELASELRLLTVRRCSYDDCPCRVNLPDLHGTPFFWSPAPLPAILQACRESRLRSSYKKAFVVTSGSSSRYIWVDFLSDIIYVKSNLLEHLPGSQVAAIRNLRVEHTCINPWWHLVEGFGSMYWKYIASHPELEVAEVMTKCSNWEPLSDQASRIVSPETTIRVINSCTQQYIELSQVDDLDAHITYFGRGEYGIPLKSIRGHLGFRIPNPRCINCIRRHGHT